MKHTFVLFLGLISTLAFANYDAEFSTTSVSPFSKNEFTVNAKLSILDSITKVKVTTTRENDPTDPDAPRNDFYCITTVKVDAGTLSASLNGSEVKTVALTAYSYFKTDDDGACTTPAFGQEAVIPFTMYADGLKHTLNETKRGIGYRYNSSLELQFSAIAEGYMLITKDKDGAYAITSLSFSSDPKNVSLFPETLKMNWAHYAQTKKDNRMTLQDSGITLLNR